MAIECSECGGFIRVLWMGNVLSVMTKAEWSKVLATRGRFVKDKAQ